MAQTWVTIPLEELVARHGHRDNVLVIRQCAICGARTVPDAEGTADEQIMLHLERRHSAMAEERRARVPARLRKRLTAQGWTPPPDDESGPPGPSGPPTETPRGEGRP